MTDTSNINLLHTNAQKLMKYPTYVHINEKLGTEAGMTVKETGKEGMKKRGKGKKREKKRNGEGE